jgi:histidyl-tRNA synthetase
VDVPIFEFTEVFARTLGETSDIVSKEMYSFTDRGGESLTLRPEFTAGIARAFISGGMAHKLPLRLYASGPAFRYERPQKGRMRQFHQIDAEALGICDPLNDADIISAGWRVLCALGLKDAVTLEINSLGDPASRAQYREALVAHLNKVKDSLSDDSKLRLERNPLRILDSKDEGDRRLLQDAPRLEDHYTPEAADFFAKLRHALDKLNIPYKVNSRLVRGMDYYCHTVFEFVTDKLGAQGAVLSGGRYDGLIGMMGGPETPATGWAAGLERLEALVEVMDSLKAPLPAPVVVAPLGDEHAADALAVADQLRVKGIATLFDGYGQLKKRFARADKVGAWAVVVIGGDEAARGAATVKLMQRSEQHEVKLAELADKLSGWKE